MVHILNKKQRLLDVGPGDILYRVNLATRKAMEVVVKSVELESKIKRTYRLIFFLPVAPAEKIRESLLADKNSVDHVQTFHIVMDDNVGHQVMYFTKVEGGISRPYMLTMDLNQTLRELGLQLSKLNNGH